MYRIIGADHQEYGPVSADTISQWIAEGRVNARTRIKPEGTEDWKAALEIPEFAPRFAPPTITPPSDAADSPFLGSPEAEALARTILARDYRLEIGRCLSRGWDLTLRHFWLLVGAGALATLILSAANAASLPGLLLSYVVVGGYNYLCLKLIRGQRAEIGDLFAGFSLAFVPLLLFSVVGQLLAGLGLLLCVLPGIYLMVAWLLFTPLLIIDKRIDFWPAMELSRKVVTRHWWRVFALALVCGLILVAGVLACFIGFFIAYPVVTAAIVHAYEDIFGPAAAPAAALTPPADAPV